MRTARIIGSTIVAVSVLTLGLAAPAAAKKDKCLAAIATELHRAGVKNINALLKSQSPAAILTAKKIGKACPTLPASLGYTGCPGTAGCATDTDTSVAGYQACVNCILTNALPSPKCGNGTKDTGEQCDGSTTGCSAGQQCSQFCTCFTPPAPPCGQLKFSFGTGTTSCGGPGLSPAGSAPFSGALFDATTGGTNLADLGKGCLFFGGGSATIVSPGLIPNGSSTILDGTCSASTPDHVDLKASAGTGQGDCTKGPKTTKHCANDGTTSCNTDADCPPSQSAKKLCQPDANCYFGPPLSLPNHNIPALSACVVNVIASNASGSMTKSTGDITLDTYGLTSLVYITGDENAACPVCTGGMCQAGARAGQACTTTATSNVSLDCLPDPLFYLGALDVNLAPLTTGATAKTAADGIYCPTPFCDNGLGACDPNDMNACNQQGVCSGQPNPGAFGVSNQSCTGAGAPFACCTGNHTGNCLVKRITENGSPAGNLSDGQPHDAALAYVFCIPPPGQPATGSSDLPGPGAVSITGQAQFVVTP